MELIGGGCRGHMCNFRQQARGIATGHGVSCRRVILLMRVKWGMIFAACDLLDMIKDRRSRKWDGGGVIVGWLDWWMMISCLIMETGGSRGFSFGFLLIGDCKYFKSIP